MHWQLTTVNDSRGRWMADRHYSRKTEGAPSFANPGHNVVLITEDMGALWVSYAPKFTTFFPEGAWVCTIFRNESRTVLSSILVSEAVAATRAVWGEPPQCGMWTLIDIDKTRPKRDPGRCFRKAGFKPAGYTKGGLLALQLLPEDMPEAQMPAGATLPMFLEATA